MRCCDSSELTICNISICIISSISKASYLNHLHQWCRFGSVFTTVNVSVTQSQKQAWGSASIDPTVCKWNEANEQKWNKQLREQRVWRGGLTKINRFPQWRTFCARCSLRLCLPKDGPEVELLKKSTSFFYEAEYSRTGLKSNIQQLRPRRLFKMGDQEASSDGFIPGDAAREMQLLFWRPISLPSFQDSWGPFSSACSS